MASRKDWLEQNYSADLLTRSQDLSHKGAVSSVTPSGKHLWTAQVSDMGEYYVHIRYPMTLRQKSDCTCTEHQTMSVCPHVVAVLMKIRDERSAATRVTKLPKSLTIHHIMEKISDDELRDFVVQQAQTDKKLALKLKIRFARHVETEDNVQKYKKILDSLIRPYTGRSTRDSSFHDIRLAIQTLRDFMGQAGDLMAMGHYSESLKILKASFPKALYLQRFYTFMSDESEEMIRQFHHIIRDFFYASLPEGIRADAIGFLQDISLLSYYEFRDMEDNVVSVSIIPRTKDRQTSWIPHLKELIKKSGEDQRPFLWALLLWIKNDITPEEKEELLLWRPDMMVKWVDNMHQKNAWHLTAPVLETYVKKNISDAALSDRLLQAYEHNRQKKEYSQLASDLFYRTAHITYLQKLDKHTPTATLTRMLAQIEKKTIRSFRHVDALISFYLSQQKIDSVRLLLHKAGNVFWLQKYEDILYEHGHRELEDLYRYLMIHSLNGGKTDLQDIRSLMAGWTTKRWHNLRRNIEKALDDYPENNPV